MNQDVIDAIKGIRCETCSEERRFGNPPENDPDTMYIYNDFSGATRCFCKEHMAFFDKYGGMTNYKEKGAVVGWGAKLMSDMLSEVK